MLKKYIYGISSVLALATLLSSCAQEELTDYQIATTCDGAVCSIELDQTDLLRYTNVVGKSVDKVLKQEAVPEPQYNITWVLTDGQLATDQQLSDSNLPLCNGDCTSGSNPTGWVFTTVGPHQIGVSGTITYPDGTVQKIDLAKTVNTQYGEVKINSEIIGGSGLDYKFTANTSGTGIPDNATFTWKVNGTEIGTGQEIEYLFPTPNITYTVGLEVSVDGEVISTATKEITSGEVVEPTLTATQDSSSDPLVWTITANTTDTGIDSSWTKQWKIDGNVVSGATANTLNYTFTQSDTTYQVEYIATKGELRRSATTNITVGTVTQPTLTATQDSSSDPLVWTITADTTDTDIDSSWTKQWKIDGNVVPGATTNTLNYTFTQSDTTYQVEYIATKGELRRIATTNITVGTVTQPTLTATQDSSSDPLVWTITADTADTSIDSSWTRQWKIDGNVVTGSTDALNYTFAQSNTTYQVEYTATKGQSTRTATISITIGAVNQPSLSSTQDGNNPLAFTITADTTDTSIDSSWTKQWKVDGSVVPGSTDALSYTFALTSKTYQVEYTATKGQSTRTATTSVTTGAATAPSLSDSRIGFLDYALTADLADTGITSAWTLQWSSNPSSATFSAASSADTNVTFGSYNINYTVTLTATPPSGSGDSPVTANVSVSTGYSLKTAATITGGDYSPIQQASGTAPTTGISWQKNGENSITFTCPTGWAIPAEIVNMPAVGDKTAYGEFASFGGSSMFLIDGTNGLLLTDAIYGNSTVISYYNLYGLNKSVGVTCVHVY